MFNGLVQTPVPIAGSSSTAPSAAASITKRFDHAELSKTNFGINVGGGAKIILAGPLRLRLDYRVFTLSGTPRHTTCSGSMRA